MGILDAIPSIPSPDLPGIIPTGVAQFLGVGQDAAPNFNQQLPSYRSQMVKKYQELSADYATLPANAQQALIEYDAGRVARGQPPLTREQSLGAIQTIRTGVPATPTPSRSPLDFFSNAVQDIGDIVKAIPRLPAQLVSEIQQIPDAAQSIVDNERAGMSHVQAITRAPGIRLIPGAYTAGNVLGGVSGIKEAITHPVMTALDVLPAAELAAKGTAVGAEAARIAEATGRPAHALQHVLTKTLDENGAIVRNPLGNLINKVQTETRAGQFADQLGGKMNRDAFRSLAMSTARVRAIGSGLEPAISDIEQIAREANVIGNKYNFDVDAAADTLRRMEADDWAGATPEQLGFHAEYKMNMAASGDYGVAKGEFGRIYNPRMPDSPELVPIAQARVVNRAKTIAEHTTRMAERVSRIKLGSVRTLDEIATDSRSILNSPTLSGSMKRVEMRSIIHELDAMGHDTTGLAKTLNMPKKRGDGMSLFTDELRNLAASGAAPATRYTSPQLIAIFQKYGAAGNRQADRLVIAIRDGNAARINDALKALEGHATKIPELVNDPAVAESLRSLRSRNDYLTKKVAGYTEKAAKRAQNTAEQRLAANIPARFTPEVERLTRDKLTDLYRTKAATPEEAAEVARTVLEKRWKDLPEYEAGVTEKLVRDTAYDISRTWMKMQEAGFDPTYVHRVNAKQVGDALKPTISEVPNTVTQLKARALDSTPYVQDATVSMSHQANEWLRRQASEEWIDHTIRQFGVKEQDLRSAYAERARRYMEGNASINLDEAFRVVMSKTHTRFNPTTEGYGWNSDRLKSLETDSYMIPNSLAKNLKAMHEPKSVLGGITDPFTKAFRISVIGLSPRTQFYNIMGGATMATGEIGLPALVKHIKSGMEYARNPEAMLADPRISDAIRASIGAEKELFADMDRSRFTGRVGDAAEFMKGRTLGRVWQQIQDSKVKAGFDKVVDASYSLNGLFDDAYKITAYLAQHDKMITRGLSKEAAELAGLELMRKTQPDWAAMTPIERNLMKSIFPFYGFMSHSMRYVMRYPMDHPLRANILASFARAELDDSQTLPGNFLSNLFITGQNSSGRATAASLGALNPFGDVANTLSLAGFMSATNPLISTALESVGLQRGQADLYPTLRYDPESGRLTSTNPNPLMALIENTVPQTQIATALLGANQEFKDKLAMDPYAAYRGLMSAGGIPILWRGLNVPVEQARAEVNRQKSAKSVLANAQKSGDWSEALRYPSLAAYYQQVKALTPEQLTPYQARPDEAAQLVSAIQGNGGQGSVPVTQQIVAPVANTGGF
jgi:hypothetical protein